jgi:hypothetical protein
MISRWVAIAVIVGFSSGTGVACEADHQAMQKTSLLPAVHSIANDKDALSLTSAQQRTAWESISRHGTIQFAASSFTTSVSVGATLPASITPHIFPAEAVARVPGLRPYDYALLRNKLLIVSPEDRKIVAVIHRHT